MLPRENDIKKFIEAQSVIRVVIDDAGNFGNQAASYNLILRIRQLGFKGKFEVIYFDDAKEKIFELFHLPIVQANSFTSEEYDIDFIALSEFISKSRDGEVESLALGISGAVDKLPTDWNHHLTDENFANALNTDSFVRFSPYHNFDDLCDTQIYLRNHESPIIRSTCDKMLVTPIATLSDANDYLDNTTDGQLLLSQQPALKSLITSIENKEINFQPAYGWTLRESPSNLLNIILGARYAQLHGNKQLQKPLIIGAFFDFDRENSYAESAYGMHIKNIDILLNLIFNDNSKQVFDRYKGGEQVKAAIKNLKLRQALHISEMTNKDTTSEIESLNPGDILLVSFPELPKTVFDGLYTHTGENIFPPVREGASTFTSLISSDKPHLHCRSTMNWEIKTDLADENLRNRLLAINGLICRENYGHELDFTAWENHPIDEIIGQYIIDASQPDSTLSNFFYQLKHDAIRPDNDRILIDLTKAVELLESQKKTSSSPLINEQQIHDSDYNHQMSSSKWINQQLSMATPAPTCVAQSSESIFDRMLRKACKYAYSVTSECPSYFSRAPHFWQPQGQQCMIENNMICSAQNMSLPAAPVPPLYLGS